MKSSFHLLGAHHYPPAHRFRQNLCRRETRPQEVFDLCSFVLIVNTIIKKEDEAAIGFDEKAI